MVEKETKHAKHEKLEREYIIPLRKAWLKVPMYERTGKAIKAIKIFLAKHMKVEERDVNKVKIDVYLNNELWFRGRANPPAKVKVKAVKENGIVKVDFIETPDKVKFLKAKHENLQKALEARQPKEKPKAVKEEIKEDKTEEEKKEEKEKETSTAEANAKQFEAKAKEQKHVPKLDNRRPIRREWLFRSKLILNKMEEEYRWNVVDNDLRLNLTRNGKMTAHYKGMHGNVLCELNMFNHYDEERIARVIVYKETPELAEFSSGRVYIQRNLGKIRSAVIPENKSSDGLMRLIKMIEEEFEHPIPCSEPAKVN